MHDVIIIGAGPAGYTAGIYCSRARHDTLLISGILPGGQLMNTTDVENYPGFSDGIMGPDLMTVMRKQTEKMGTKIIDDEVTSVDFKNRPLKVKTASEEFEARAVIVCTGANPRKIGLEGEQTFAGKGVSYCATCDGAFFRDQELIVVGGGDSALDWAITLNDDADSTTLIHRREEFRAAPETVNKVSSLISENKIKFHLGQVKSLNGKDGVLDNVVCSQGDNEIKIDCDTILPFFGLTMKLGPVANWGINLNENLVSVDTEKFETDQKGIFAIGDINTYPGKLKLILSGFHEAALHGLFF